MSYETCYVVVVPLHRTSVPSNSVRAPKVARGEALIVDRYAKEPKVALVNPDDLAMLEESHDLLQTISKLEPLDLDDLTLKAIAAEDRPDPNGALEDPEKIAALLGL